MAASDLSSTKWITGPEFLKRNQHITEDLASCDSCSLEIDPEMSVLHTGVTAEKVLDTERYNRFSQWKKFVRAIGISTLLGAIN